MTEPQNFSESDLKFLNKQVAMDYFPDDALKKYILLLEEAQEIYLELAVQETLRQIADGDYERPDEDDINKYKADYVFSWKEWGLILNMVVFLAQTSPYQPVIEYWAKNCYTVEHEVNRAYNWHMRNGGK